MDQEKQIDDIVAMLDDFMGNNGGHMDIRVQDDGSVHTDVTIAKTVTTTNSLECREGEMACSIPTLFEGLDAEDTDE